MAAAGVEPPWVRRELRDDDPGDAEVVPPGGGHRAGGRDLPDVPVHRRRPAPGGRPGRRPGLTGRTAGRRPAAGSRWRPAQDPGAAGADRAAPARGPGAPPQVGGRPVRRRAVAAQPAGLPPAHRCGHHGRGRADGFGRARQLAAAAPGVHRREPPRGRPRADRPGVRAGPGAGQRDRRQRGAGVLAPLRRPRRARRPRPGARDAGAQGLHEVRAAQRDVLRAGRRDGLVRARLDAGGQPVVLRAGRHRGARPHRRRPVRDHDAVAAAGFPLQPPVAAAAPHRARLPRHAAAGARAAEHRGRRRVRRGRRDAEPGRGRAGHAHDRRRAAGAGRARAVQPGVVAGLGDPAVPHRGAAVGGRRSLGPPQAAGRRRPVRLVRGW